MSMLYGAEHRALQDQFDMRPLADRVEQFIVHPVIQPEHRAFIESRDFFFLTTIDHRGYPTVSHKGGNPGFVRVLDDATLAFPSLDGNGMFLSMGNIQGNPKVGMLFIDFETPHRVRVHGEATVSRDDALLRDGHPGFTGAELVVRVKLSEIFINCPRYIHRYQRIESARHVPQADCPTPPPQWKRIDGLQDALPERDRHIGKEMGLITPDEYAALVQQGRA
ncbi:pyridoxamine 5'-phosphate oxidase family protein [Methyloversatilis thermotolerans]|uniref:pyridoxamine 5'-phosphate oxidase family protein n=1 Tax=Methyloversatilis thermotolerans TaxID=1346290 RepID=UPI00037FA5BC|nr:pyridoxamine 5'-phosphate oxidase family protein [Methyloversatilis thermotolerans]